MYCPSKKNARDATDVYYKNMIECCFQMAE